MKNILPVALSVLLWNMPTPTPAQAPRDAQTAAAQALSGRWFLGGDPSQPVYIEVFPADPFGLSTTLVFVNNTGQRSRGDVLPGNTLIAYDWPGNGPNGRLTARIVGDPRRGGNGTILWDNNTYWARVANYSGGFPYGPWGR